MFFLKQFAKYDSVKINNLFCGVGGRMARKIFRLKYKKLKSEGGIGADYISID